jgi:hypothetical protein
VLTDCSDGDAAICDLHGEIRRTVEHLAHLLNKLPPDERRNQLVSVPLSNLEELENRAARFEALVNGAYGLDMHHRKVGTRESFLVVLGQFFKFFQDCIQGINGKEHVKLPTFTDVVLGEIADLQNNVPSKYFSSDQKDSYNPHRSQYLALKSTAAAQLRLAMDRGEKQGKAAVRIADALNAGGFKAGYAGGKIGQNKQIDKVDRGIEPRSVIDWMRKAEKEIAPFSEAYRKTLGAFRQAVEFDRAAELAALTRKTREMIFSEQS